MRRYILIAAGLFALLGPAKAADSSVPAMTAGAAVSDTDLLYCVQSAGTLDRKCTPLQLSTYIFGKVSGDLTCSAGVCTLAASGATAGSYTNANITVDAKGRVTAAANGSGGGGAPGGTSGQVQFNNAGAFGGFTLGGDATLNTATGALTLATVNSNTGAFGGATTCVAVATNAKGLITAVSAVTCTPAIASITGLGTGVAAFLGAPSSANLAATVTGETGSGALVFGTLPSFTTGFTIGGVAASGNYTRGNGTNFVSSAIQAGDLPLATSGAFGAVKVDGTTITATGGVISAPGGGSGTVTSVAAGCGVTASPSPITTTGTLGASIGARINTTTSDPIVAADCGGVVYENSASAVAVTLPATSTTGFGSGAPFMVCNINSGLVTVTPASGTLGGQASLAVTGGVLSNPTCAQFRSDGTNYTLLDTVKGAGVTAAMGHTLSVAGGLASTIAGGTATIPATAIASGACATAVTVSGTGIATTDVLAASFAADPTSTTGFLPTAMLTIVPFVTSGNAGFRACNLTSASITPTATTINWKVVR